jgi:PAS domain S-box-containing protein
VSTAASDSHKHLFTHFPDPLFVEDAAGLILEANTAAARMLGIAAEELAGRNSAEFLSPESLERLSPLLKNLRSDGRLQLEAQFIGANGAQTDVQLQAVIVPWQAGEPSAKSGVKADHAYLFAARPSGARDAAEREWLALRESSGHGPFGVAQALFHVSSQHAVTGFSYPGNPRAAELNWVRNLILSPKLKFALDRAWAGEELLLEPAWYSRIAVPAGANTSGALAAVAEEAQRARSFEEAAERQVWLRLAFWPLRREAAVAAVLVQAADCTAQRVSEELEELNTQARFLALVTASIHHELNNHLSVIIAQASAMRMAAPQGQLPPPNVGAIIDAGQDAVTLLRRAAEALHQGQVAPESDLNAIVADAVELLRHTLPREISVRAELGPDAPRVHADAGLLRALILLLARQLQSRLTGGVLTLRTYRPEQVHPSLVQSAFSIEDSGSRQSGPRPAPGGTESPQLALARTIARYHRAQLELIPGAQGTVIELTLPGIDKAAPRSGKPGAVSAAASANLEDHFQGLSRTAGEGPRPRDEVPPGNGRDGNKVPGAVKRILIADDEENFRTFMGWALSQQGFEVVLAANGQEAFERFQENPGEIDLAILDAYMPLMGGLEAYLRMQVLRPELPVLFASGFVRGPSAETLIDGCPGPAHVLLKPFSAEDLLAAVEAAIAPPLDDDIDAPPPTARKTQK